MKKAFAAIFAMLFVFSALAVLPHGARADSTTTGLIFEYDFYKGSSQQSGTEILDASGNGNNGEIQGTPTWNSDSIHFGTGQRVVVNATLSTYTIIIEVSPQELATTLGHSISMFQITNSSGVFISVYFYKTSNDLMVTYGTTSYNTNVSENVGNKYFIVLEQTSAYFSVSVNGEETNNLTAIATSGTYTFYIGCSPGTTDETNVNYYFAASYNRALSSDEITSVQNTINGQNDNGGSSTSLSIAWVSGSPFTVSAGTEISATIAGQTQFVHPSIVYFPKNSPAGYHYVMAITPYPSGDNQQENPSIAFSNDLVHWTEDGVSNPLVTPTSLNVEYLSDPNLLYANGQFYLYFRGLNSTSQNIYLMTSKDAHHWSNPQLVLSTNSLLSPSIIYDNGLFKMWGQSNVSNQNVLVYYTSADGVKWTEVGTSGSITVTYNNNTYQFWHLEVRKAGAKYYMLATFCNPGTSGGSPRANFWLESNDGLNWTAYSTPVQTNSNSYATDGVYKATFWIYNNTVNIIYSYKNSDKTWHIAYTSAQFTAPDSSNVVITNSTNGGGNDNGTNNGTTGTGGAGGSINIAMPDLNGLTQFFMMIITAVIIIAIISMFAEVIRNTTKIAYRK